jgi:hypothetical protein
VTPEARQIARQTVQAAIAWWGELGSCSARRKRLDKKVATLAGRRGLDPEVARRMREARCVADLYDLKAELED